MDWLWCRETRWREEAPKATEEEGARLRGAAGGGVGGGGPQVRQEAEGPQSHDSLHRGQ